MIEKLIKKLRELVIKKPLLFRVASFVTMPKALLFFYRKKKIDMKTNLLTIKAHHLFCLTRHNAVKNYHPTLPLALKKIKSKPNFRVKVVTGIDDVCRACPYYRRNRCTRWDIDLERLQKDKKFLKEMGLKDGEIMSA